MNVLPLHLYNKLQVKSALKTTTMKLSAYGGTAIKPNGTYKLTCTSNSKLCDVTFYVAPVNAQPIFFFFCFFFLFFFFFLFIFFIIFIFTYNMIYSKQY